MSRLLYAFAALCLVGTTACGTKKDAPGTYHAIDTIGAIKLTGEPIKELMTSGCRELISFGDYFLVYAPLDNKLLHLIVRKTGEVVCSFAQMGRSEEEFLQIGNVHKIDSNRFSAYDNNARKVAYYRLDSLLGGRLRPVAITTIEFPEKFTKGSVNQVYMLPDGDGIYSGGTGVENQGVSVRFALTDTKNQTATYFYGYPYAKDTVLMKVAYNTLPPLVAVSPDASKMVVANTPVGALMELFDIGVKKIELVATRYFTEPVFEYKNYRMTNSAGSDMGFTDISASGNKIVALYIGCPVDKAMPKSKIVLFDWNGEVEQVYSIDNFGSQIIYDEIEKAFYTVELQAPGGIVLTKYPIP